MRTRYYVPAIREAEEAIKQISKDVGKVPAELQSREQRLIDAATLLGTMCDQGMVRANAARAQAGWASTIRMRRESGARCYYAPAQHGGERILLLVITLPLLDGDRFGGAYIKSGSAQWAIYVVPAIDTGPPRWLVQASGTELTAATIDDLFQATFSDDEDALKRLAPLWGFDLFATPWS